MARQFLITTFALITFLVVPNANGVERGHSSGGAKSESKEAPGGSWSEPTHHGGQNQSHHTYSNPSTSEHEASGSGEHNNESKSKSAESSGTHNDAAGAAAVNRHNTPTATGAEGAAAGAAHSNRNAPQASGAEGAAAGSCPREPK